LKMNKKRSGVVNSKLMVKIETITSNGLEEKNDKNTIA